MRFRGREPFPMETGPPHPRRYVAARGPRFSTGQDIQDYPTGKNVKASKTKTLPAALACLGLTLALSHSLGAQEQPGTRYVDPSQLDVPWPRHSFVKVPWRAFLETKSGDDFLRGI